MVRKGLITSFFQLPFSN